MATFEGYPWKQPYTAQQLQDAQTNQVPIIGSNNHWWRWDINTSAWVDTGVLAIGQTGETGATGPQGPEGTGLEILDAYTTLADLKAAHPTGTAGDAYAVGDTTGSEVYIWSDADNNWTSIGPYSIPDGSVTEKKLAKDVADMLHEIDETTRNIYDYLTTDPIYGFIEHNAILAPGSRIEYIGANKNFTPIQITMGGGFSLNSWADFDWLLANKPYMVKSDGTPDYRLNEDDYTKREDGTASDVANTAYNGGAYAWARKIWKKEWMAGDDRHVLFSLTAREGFEPWGFKDFNDTELEGVWIPMFYGSVVDGKMKSIAGTTPDMSKTTDAQKTAITALSSRAVFLGGPIVQTLIDLMILFAKTTDLQAAYGRGNCSGYVNDASKNYGLLDNAVVGGGQFYGTSDSKSLNKIFHSIVLGTYQQWMRDPYTVCGNGRFKVSNNYTYDVTGAKYTDTGVNVPQPASTGWAYPHKYQTVPGFGHLPVHPYNGSTTTGGCDGLYRSATQATITAVALRFGDCGLGAACGPRALSVARTAGTAAWPFGSASLLLPPAGVGV